MQTRDLRLALLPILFVAFSLALASAQEEPKPKPEPQPESKTDPAPATESKPEPKPEAKPEPKPEAPRVPPPLSLTIEGDITPEMAPVAGKLAALFYESYPELLKRYENPDKFAARKIKLIFKKGIKVPGYSHRDSVTVSVEWLEKHPDDIGLFTHELTHLVQAYPNSNPGWLTEGIADYARHKFGPRDQSWRLPRKLRPEQSYKNSYGVTARFLVWLDEKHPGTVDKLHRQMQQRKFELEDFEKFTGQDVETLWRECVKELDQ